MTDDPTCATCGEAVGDELRSIRFGGETYCSDCTTLAECSNCGAKGRLPESALDGESGVRCGNCDGVLTG